MAIFAAYEMNDARGSARLLAGTALKYLADTVQARLDPTAMNNVYRMLETYRVERFVREEPDSDARQWEALNLLSSHERNAAEVRAALDAARQEVYGGLPRQAAVKEIEHVLESVTYGDDAHQPQAEDKDKALKFFGVLMNRLDTSPT